MLGPLVPGAIVEPRVVAEIPRNQVQRAGLLTIPALVRAFDPLARKASQIVENDDRVGFTPLERAAAYQELLTPRR